MRCLSQLELLDILTKMAEADRSQFIVARHSPILLACPGAVIYSFDSAPVKSVRYEQTTHYQICANFLSNRNRYQCLE
jgi:predicted ATPase